MVAGALEGTIVSFKRGRIAHAGSRRNFYSEFHDEASMEKRRCGDGKPGRNPAAPGTPSPTRRIGYPIHAAKGSTVM